MQWKFIPNDLKKPKMPFKMVFEVKSMLFSKKLKPFIKGSIDIDYTGVELNV
ncbi:MAG: hypothetical protein K2I77_01460 [Anaeroplasmataceae bacterium]|nr:hypothetical protein [Anaeroplasmataceae bacterium]